MRKSTTLSHPQARRAYDRIGAWQDSQRFYEDRATNLLVEHGDFGSAESLFEFGCGTGRFAARLLGQYLPESARYRGIDLSPRMVRLAQARLAPYAPRAQVVLSDGAPPTSEPGASCDRFVSNFVFDLLSSEDIRAVLAQAHRMLRPEGLLCLSGLSTGIGPGSRIVAAAIGWIQSKRPALVGGCRPIDLLPFLTNSAWRVEHHFKVARFGLPSEAVVARRR